MGPFSKKSDEQAAAQTDSPSANVSNDTTPPTTLTTAPEPLVKKEKHSKAFSFVSVLFLLMLLVAGVMTYLWYDQKTRVEGLESEIDGAEQTVTSLRSELTKASGANPDTSVASPAPVKTDEELIKQAVTAYHHAYKGAENEKYTIGVTKKDNSFAWAGISSIPPEGGAKCILKKVDNTWVVLLCGQSAPSQDDIDRWGIPKEFAS